MHGFRPATHAPDLSLHVKRCDIAPDRRLGSLGQLGNILNRHDRLFLYGAQYDAMAFAFVHGFLLHRLFRSCDNVSIISDHIFPYCVAT